MKSFFPGRAIWPAAALFACACAHAARPMVVDDAAITAPGQCQLESWTQRTPGQTEYWAMPACNLGGSWELAAGLGRIGPDGAARAYRAGVVQAKTVLRPLSSNGWGLGLTVANQFRQGQGIAGDLSVLVPLSVSLLDDRLLLHVNAGWLRAHADGRHDGVWAAGAEWTAHPRLALTLEAYGSGRGHGFAQAGVRLAVIPERLAFDAGLGSRSGRPGAERYATVGLTLAADMLR